MLILQIDVDGVLTVKSEGDPPVAGDADGIAMGPPLQRVEHVAWRVQVAGATGRVERRDDAGYSGCVLTQRKPSCLAGHGEVMKRLVPEAPDHACKLAAYGFSVNYPLTVSTLTGPSHPCGYDDRKRRRGATNSAPSYHRAPPFRPDRRYGP